MQTLREPSTLTHKPATSVAHLEGVKQAIRTMHERFSEPLSLADLAGTACMSSFHFSRVFSEVTGISPSRFLAALRMAGAKRLLIATDRRITEICMDVGYNSLGTFTTLFNEFVGIAPMRFRELAQADPSGAELRGCLEFIMSHTCCGDQEPALHGWIDTPEECGPVFIGLFPTPIPQSFPPICAVRKGAGEFKMGPVSPELPYVCGVAFQSVESTLSLLAPDFASLRVGLARLAETPEAPGVATSVRLPLRPPALTDPPIVVALPLLVAERVKLLTAGIPSASPDFASAAS